MASIYVSDVKIGENLTYLGYKDKEGRKEYLKIYMRNKRAKEKARRDPILKELTLYRELFGPIIFETYEVNKKCHVDGKVKDSAVEKTVLAE